MQISFTSKTAYGYEHGHWSQVVWDNSGSTIYEV